MRTMFSKRKSAKKQAQADFAAPTTASKDTFFRKDTYSTSSAEQPATATTDQAKLATAPAFDFDLNSNGAILNAQGAALHAHNRDLVKRLTELKDKREELDNLIAAEDQEKQRYEEHLIQLQQRLQEVIEGLVKKNNVKAEVERVIEETESAYGKLVESSHSLLGLLERETLNIQKERKSEAEILM